MERHRLSTHYGLSTDSLSFIEIEEPTESDVTQRLTTPLSVDARVSANLKRLWLRIQKCADCYHKNLELVREQLEYMLVIPRYAVTAYKTDHYILVVFVVMSKEEGSMYRGKLHIPIILGRINTSSNSVETFQHWQKSKNEAIHNYADLIATYSTFFPPILPDSASDD